MRTVPAVGRGPIDFVGSDGNQLTIPLSAIKFVDGKPTSDIAAEGLDVWLKYLADHGQLTPGSVPAPPAAMVFKATAESATGNDITLTVAAAAGGGVEITVTERHVYEGLVLEADTAQSIDNVLDDTSGAIVHVKTIDDTMRALVPVEGPLNEADHWAIKDKDGHELATLDPRSGDWNKGTLTVGLDQVNDKVAPVTFMLTMQWTSKHFTLRESDLRAGSLTADDLAFSVKIEHVPKLPKPGVYALQGGANAKDAEQATATLPANE